MNRLEVEVILREELQQIVDIDGEVAISAIGYDYLNKIAEISLLAPDMQIYNNKEVSNPYIIYNDEGTINRVIYKCFSYGVGPMGNRVITSSTIEYNPDVQLLKDLTYVVCNDSEAGRITKEYLLTEKEKREGYTIPLKDDLIIFCNLENADINKAFSTYANNKAYAERVSQTLARRNALKAHPALSSLITSVNGIKGSRSTKVKITKIYDDFDKDNILEYLKTQNVEVLKNECIEIGTQIYECNEASSNNEGTSQPDINIEKQMLLDILKKTDKVKIMAAIRRLNLYESGKPISSFSSKQLEMIIQEIGA